MKKLLVILCIFNSIFILHANDINKNTTIQNNELTFIEGIHFGDDKEDIMSLMKKSGWKVQRQGHSTYDHVTDEHETYIWYINGSYEGKKIVGKDSLHLDFYDNKFFQAYIKFYISPDEQKSKIDIDWCEKLIAKIISTNNLKRISDEKNIFEDYYHNKFYYYTFTSTTDKKNKFYELHFYQKKEEKKKVEQKKEISRPDAFLPSEFSPGNQMRVFYRTDNNKVLIGNLYPQSYIPRNLDTTCICSKIAPATDGFVELVITISEPTTIGYITNNISLYLKENDQIELNFLPLDLFEISKVNIKILSAVPNLIKFEVLTEQK